MSLCNKRKEYIRIYGRVREEKGGRREGRELGEEGRQGGRGSKREKEEEGGGR
jgi:hypothetical protein